MNPFKYAQMIKYLTRVKKQKPDLPDVFSASKAPIPPKTQNVEEIEAINRFNRANPRQDMAGGGMLVQPSADGSRPGYATPGTGANQFTVMKEKAEKFLEGKKEVKQSDFIKELKKIGYKDPQALSSVIANRNNVKLIRDVSLKRSPNIEAVTNELSGS
jgi:ribosomal protein S18